MPVDQAAGLRREAARANARIVSLFCAQPGTALGAAGELQNAGARVLLIDRHGRHAPPAHALFHWRQQLARHRLQTYGQNGVDILHAPGAQAGEASIVALARAYDHVVFDGPALSADTVELEIRTRQTLVLEVDHDAAARLRTYALLKTLHCEKLAWHVILYGDFAACNRLRAASARFLQATPGGLEIVAPSGTAQLAALAARIRAEPTGPSRLQKNSGGVFTRHG